MCKFKGRWTSLTWNEIHQKEFDDIKDLLSDPTNLSPYNPSLPLFLQVDSAKSPPGTGCILYQEDPTGKKNILQLDSKKLPESYANYSPYLLELAGATWASYKTKFLTLGVPYTIVTDSLTNCRGSLKDLSKIESMVAMNLWDKLSPFVYDFQHIKGKDNILCDILSRNPRVHLSDQFNYIFEEMDNNFNVCMNIDDSNGGVEIAMTPPP